MLSGVRSGHSVSTPRCFNVRSCAWEALNSDRIPSDKEQAKLVALLRVVMELDRIGDVLARWAVDIAGDSPDAAVDAAATEVGEGLDALGVPHEERPPPRRARPSSATKGWRPVERRPHVR